MNEKQHQYYKEQLSQIRRGGYKHEAFAITSIGGMGSSKLGPVDPPVVGFGQDGDPFYVQYLQSWEEIDALIAEIIGEAEKAWGKREVKNG